MIIHSKVERRAGQALILLLAAAMVAMAGCTPQIDTPAQQPPESSTPPGTPPEQAVENDEARTTSHTPGKTGAERREAPVQSSGEASEQAAHPLSMQRSSKLLAHDAARPVPQPLDPNIVWPVEPTDRENYAALDDNPVRLVREHPVSTFSIDVDTGAYANVRRFLNHGQLPPTDAVRIEELINYFSYEYPLPGNRDTPFSISTEMAAAPWNDEALLLSVGIRGYEPDAEQRPPANLVFLLDVSGSMNSQDKLPLLKNAFRLLTRRLTGDDRVSIVVYAGASGLVLEPTAGDQQARILAALDRLHAGGSTNGGDGIRLAYSVAADGFIEEGINRVILATDGDFNVGTVNHESLIDLIERQRDKGIALTTLGFGQGNYNDHLLEQLADHGNGNYAYIDTLNEARKVLVEELASTLLTIARDVKIQIEFNPALVAEYRLIGYENRMLRREDFNNDRVDAGDIGAGHTVTALYELKLVGSGSLLVDPLRYGAAVSPSGGDQDELAHLRLRYKAPGADTSRLIERSLLRSELRRLDDTSDDFRFAAAVAGFGQSLRGGRYLGDYGLDGVVELARDARGGDPHGYRSEFISLVALAQSIDPSDRVAAR